MDFLEIIKATDGLIAVAVLIYFGRPLVAEMSRMRMDMLDIINRLIDLCADADDKQYSPNKKRNLE